MTHTKAIITTFYYSYESLLSPHSPPTPKGTITTEIPQNSNNMARNNKNLMVSHYNYYKKNIDSLP